MLMTMYIPAGYKGHAGLRKGHLVVGSLEERLVMYLSLFSSLFVCGCLSGISVSVFPYREGIIIVLKSLFLLRIIIISYIKEVIWVGSVVTLVSAEEIACPVFQNGAVVVAVPVPS